MTADAVIGMLSYAWAMLVLAIPIFAAGVFFYFYRLEDIPGIKFWQTVVLLVICRILDISSFLWAARGDFLEAEVNLPYQALAPLFPHAEAFGISLVISNVVIFGSIWMAYLFTRSWGPPRETRRFMHVLIATASLFSLVGAATNLAFGIWGWGSPLLVG